MVDNFKILKQFNNKLETASNEQIFVKKLQSYTPICLEFSTSCLVQFCNCLVYVNIAYYFTVCVCDLHML